jgi:hypothetical protein
MKLRKKAEIKEAVSDLHRAYKALFAHGVVDLGHPLHEAIRLIEEEVVKLNRGETV